MAINIKNYKNKGQVYANTYAKVDNIVIDNNSKLVNFRLCIYPDKASNNLIFASDKFTVKILEDNIKGKCYEHLKTLIDANTAKLKAYEDYSEITTDLEIKTKYEVIISKMKVNVLSSFADYEDILDPIPEVVPEA